MRRDLSKKIIIIQIVIILLTLVIIELSLNFVGYDPQDTCYENCYNLDIEGFQFPIWLE